MKMIVILFSLVIILGLGIFLTAVTTKNMIEVYDKYTLESVHEKEHIRGEFDLPSHIKTPKDFGFPNYKEYEFFSYSNKIMLNHEEHMNTKHIKSHKLKLTGWFIPSESNNSKKCIVFFHGRTSNRLKPFKFLELIKKYDLNEEYSIFLPDLRNSGNSDHAKTYMGYTFADDIYASLNFVKEKFGKNDFIVYSFSMGSMGSAIMLNRYKDKIKKNNIKIDKIIMDSPISNVKKTIINEAKKSRVPKFIATISCSLFDADVDYYLPHMKFSYLLKDVKIPILILQGNADTSTLYSILKSEEKNLPANVKIIVFDKATHVRPYLFDKEKYSDEVFKFIKN